jgi:hypothetical protein
MNKKIFFKGISGFLGLVFWIQVAHSQTFQPIEENQVLEANGLTYGYRIKSLQKKAVKNKGDFDRYELVAYITNNRGCDITVRLTGNETQEQLRQLQVPLIEFECGNATGYRLTSKGTMIRAEEHRINYKFFTKDNQGKNIENRASALAGYFFAAGSTREDTFIVIVPIGEKPTLQARLNVR